jgi:hypothetical protein
LEGSTSKAPGKHPNSIPDGSLVRAIIANSFGLARNSSFGWEDLWIW